MIDTEFMILTIFITLGYSFGIFPEYDAAVINRIV